VLLEWKPRIRQARRRRSRDEVLNCDVRAGSRRGRSWRVFTAQPKTNCDSLGAAAGVSLGPSTPRVERRAMLCSWPRGFEGGSPSRSLRFEPSLRTRTFGMSNLPGRDRKPGSGFGKLPLLMIKRIASKQGQRDDPSTGERRQLRDAMILQAHARDGRDILVSDDVKAFGREGDDRRRKLEALCGTRIMTVDEFCGYAKQGHSAA
jgi:hypothetical protein